MPLKIYEHHQPQDIVCIPLQEEVVCDMVLLYPKKRKLPASAVVFVDFMKHASKK